MEVQHRFCWLLQSWAPCSFVHVKRWVSLLSSSQLLDHSLRGRLGSSIRPGDSQWGGSECCSFAAGLASYTDLHSYAMQWLIVLPLEIIAASLTLSYWDESLTRAIFVSVFLVVIIVINMFGVKGYGEAEFIFSIIKVIAVIGFM